MKNIIYIPFKSLFIDRTITFDILFFSILLLAIPVILITGPALPDIFLSVIAFYFLVKSIIHKLWNYFSNPIVIGFLLFSTYGIIISLFSEMPLVSLSNEGSIFYFRYIFFSMGVWYLLDNNPYLPKCLINVTFICLSIVIIDGLYQYFFEFNLLGNKKYNSLRLTGLFGNEPIIGRYIAYISLFTFALIFQNYKITKKMMLISISFLVLCVIMVFLTGERTPFFYIILFTLLLITFFPNYRIYRIASILAIISLTLGIFIINPNAKIRMIDMTINQISKTKIPLLPYTSSHELHFESALKMFYDKPIFGVGTNTFRFQCNKQNYFVKYGCGTHPHNYYIQLLAEQGIVGFSFISIFFLYLSAIFIKQLVLLIKKTETKQIPFEYLLYPMILFIYWWPLIPHMSLYNNWNNVMIMLPLGFFMKYFYGNKIDGHSHKT